MEAVILSSPTLDGQDVFIRFTPSGQTEYIDLGLQLLPYTFYPELLVPPLPSKVGTFFIYCSGLQCTYEVFVGDIPPTPTPTPTPTITPTITPTVTPTPTLTPSCSVIPSLSIINLNGFTISGNTFGDQPQNTLTLSGSNLSVGQESGNTYYWYSGSTNITPTGNTQVISFDLSGYTSAFTISFVCINSLGCGNTTPITIVPFLPAFINIISTTPDSGYNDGTVTFEVVGGYPPPPYASSETYFIFDCTFANFVVTSTNTPQTFSGYTSGSCDLYSSSYSYGASPSTGFTIGFDPCYNPLNIPTAVLISSNYSPCEGTYFDFTIETNGDYWELYYPNGSLYNSGIGPCSYCYEYNIYADVNANGNWTLNTFNATCSASTTVNIGVILQPQLYYTLVRNSILGNNDGYLEINSSNTDFYYDDYLNYIPCCPGQVYSIPDFTVLNYYANNACFSFNYLYTYSDPGCVSIPSVDLSANTLTVCSGGTLELSAFGGVSYQFFNVLNGPSTYNTSVVGDPITGATVTVTTNAQPGVHNGTYACQVTDSSGCMNYQTINISVIVC